MSLHHLITEDFNVHQLYLILQKNNHFKNLTEFVKTMATLLKKLMIPCKRADSV